MVQTFKKIGVGVFSLGLSLSCLNANEKKVNVDFFPMLHPVSSMMEDPQSREMVLKSQHALMVYLQENPDSYVFLESSYASAERDTYFDPSSTGFFERDAYRGAVDLIFQSKVPFVYEQFTELQKEMTLEPGLAVSVMFNLGYVKAMLPTNTKEEFKAYVVPYVGESLKDSDIDRLWDLLVGKAVPSSVEESQRFNEFKLTVFDLREQAALRQIQKFTEENPEVKNVVLVYGAFHDFLKYREQEVFSDLNIRKINTKRYTRTSGNFLSGGYLSEPRFEQFRMNPATNTFEMIPGMSLF